MAAGKHPRGERLDDQAKVFQFAGAVSPVAGEEPTICSMHCRPLYKKDSAEKHHLSRSARRSALFWLDRRRAKAPDETSYAIRFTPRKAKSIWSLVNVGHVERLTKEELWPSRDSRPRSARSETHRHLRLRKQTARISHRSARRNFAQTKLREFFKSTPSIRRSAPSGS